jgi:hypothetical protein
MKARRRHLNKCMLVLKSPALRKVVFVLSLLTLVGCGPSQEEIEAQKNAAFWKTVAYLTIGAGIVAVALVWSENPPPLPKGGAKTDDEEPPLPPPKGGAKTDDEEPPPNTPDQPIAGVYIIDGLNVTRSFHYDSGFRLETLLTLCLAIGDAGASFLCIFDASGRSVAKEAKTPMALFEKLIDRCNGCFSEVTGGIQADEFILLRADTGGFKVISNDRFNKPQDNHFERYPWVNDPHRLIKGRVMNRRLLVPALRIDTPILHDIYGAVDRLILITRKNRVP